MIVQNSHNSENILDLCFDVKVDLADKESLLYINALLGDAGSGSILQCLKELNFASALCCGANENEFVTSFRLLSMEITLT